MYYDASYKKMIEERRVKAKFLIRICEQLDGPMSEFLWDTFGDEVEIPEYE